MVSITWKDQKTTEHSYPYVGRHSRSGSIVYFLGPNRGLKLNPYPADTKDVLITWDEKNFDRVESITIFNSDKE